MCELEQAVKRSCTFVITENSNATVCSQGYFFWISFWFSEQQQRLLWLLLLLSVFPKYKFPLFRNHIALNTIFTEKAKTGSAFGSGFLAKVLFPMNSVLCLSTWKLYRSFCRNSLYRCRFRYRIHSALYRHRLNSCRNPSQSLSCGIGELHPCRFCHNATVFSGKQHNVT